MARCRTCGNDYDKPFAVEMNGERHYFDSFECAIHALAPRCPVCDVGIVGHGVESDGVVYCGAHCAQRAGVGGITVRVDSTASS